MTEPGKESDKETNPVFPNGAGAIIGEAGYLDLVRRVMAEGVLREDRTGTGTWSLFGPQMRFNLRNGGFPLLTTKQVIFHIDIAAFNFNFASEGYLLYFSYTRRSSGAF